MSSGEKGLIVVFEGVRTKLLVYRRIFTPIPVREENVNTFVNIDAGFEREVTYDRAEEYGLDDPFKIISLIRLARAMKMLQPEPSNASIKTFKVTICRRSELIGPEVEVDDWIPFDLTRVKPIEDKVKEAKRRARWINRLRKR